MKTRRLRNIGFHFSLAVGSLHGLLLLVQSIATYYQVSRILVTAELRRQALRQTATIERSSQRLNVREPADLSPVLRQVQRDFLPSANVALDTLDFAAECAPAQQVGPDRAGAGGRLGEGIAGVGCRWFAPCGSTRQRLDERQLRA